VCRGQRGILPDLAQNIDAGNVGQMQIEDDQRRGKGLHLSQRDRAVQRNDGVEVDLPQRFGIEGG